MLDFVMETGNIRTLESALRVASMRNKVIANNIANVDTPLFKRSEVLFEDYLNGYMDYLDSKNRPAPFSGKLELAATNRRHIVAERRDEQEPFLGAVVRTVEEETMRTDGNNVDIDSEMAMLAKNTMYYQAVAQRISGYFNTLRTVVEGR